MALDFLRDSGGDLAFCNGDLALVEDGTAVLQSLRERLLSLAGEWFLDEEGIPYLSTVWGKSVSFRVIYALLLETVKETPGIAHVSEYEITLETENRQLNLHCAFQTIYDTAEELNICLSAPFDTSALLDTANEAILDSQNDTIKDTT